MGFDWNAGCSGFGSGDYKTRAIVAEPENVPVAKRSSVWSAESAEYGYPVGLRNLGMISQDDNACCSFLLIRSLTVMLVCGLK